MRLQKKKIPSLRTGSYRSAMDRSKYKTTAILLGSQDPSLKINRDYRITRGEKSKVENGKKPHFVEINKTLPIPVRFLAEMLKKCETEKI